MSVKDVDVDDVHCCTLIHYVTLALNLGKHVEEDFLRHNLSLVAIEKSVKRTDVVGYDVILYLGQRDWFHLFINFYLTF